MTETLKLNSEKPQDFGGPDWLILEKYAEDERNRVEKYKLNLQQGAYDQTQGDVISPEDTLKKYEQEQIIDRPKIIRKLGRIALDTLRIRPDRLEQTRNREAMAVAVDEFKTEKVNQILQETELDISHDVKNIIKENIDKEKQEIRRQKEEAKLALEIGQEHDIANRERHEFFQNMAKQEILERELNSKLTPIEEIDAYAESDDSRVTKNNIEFEGEDITVYQLNGFPMKFLAHVLNYREGDNNISTGGRDMSSSLIANPSLWNETPSDYREGQNWQLDKKTMANTLSTSYVDLSTGIDSWDHLSNQHNHSKENSHRIVYGFDYVRPTSLLYAKHADGQISPRKDQSNAYRDVALQKLGGSVLTVENLNADNSTNKMYNEVAMFRYNEKGEPLPPKFMITDEDVAPDLGQEPEEEYSDGTHNYAYYSNAIKRHAIAHNIPIIQINRDSYK